MKMDKVAGSQNDEFYTPRYAVEPILKYIPNKSRVWCPFDTQDSNFVKMLLDKDCTVLATHIEAEQDFFTMEVPTGIDYIVSNPPYSVKTEVLQRLFEIHSRHGIMFAMLVGVVGLFESQRRFEMFRDNHFEIMYMNRRIAYFKDFTEPKPSLNPPFSSVYICSGILPRDIVFEEIKK